MQLGIGVKAAALAVGMALAAPAQAQDDPEAGIDALIDGSSTPEGALALAHRQAGDHDLTGAAATLERALLIAPAEASAPLRLYYTHILCSLGDAQTARAELARVDPRAMTDTEWAETSAACPGVQRPVAKREGYIHGQLAAGLTYDSDLAGSLLVQLDLPGAVPRDDGLSFAGSADLETRLPVGHAFLYGDASLMTRNRVSGPNGDYQTGGIEAGFGVQSGDAQFSIGGILRHTRVAGDPFLTDYGAAGTLALLLGDAQLTLRGEVVEQNYIGSTALFSRDGVHYDDSIAYRGSAGTTGYWLGAAYERKDADTRRTGYAGFRGYAGLREAIGSAGTYASFAAVVRHVDYVDEPGYAPVSETRWFSRAALGLPLGPEGLDVEAAGSYSWRVYNRASGFRNYEDIGGELRLVWNFSK